MSELVELEAEVDGLIAGKPPGPRLRAHFSEHAEDLERPIREAGQAYLAASKTWAAALAIQAQLDADRAEYARFRQLEDERRAEFDQLRAQILDHGGPESDLGDKIMSLNMARGQALAKVVHLECERLHTIARLREEAAAGELAALVRAALAQSGTAIEVLSEVKRRRDPHDVVRSALLRRAASIVLLRRAKCGDYVTALAGDRIE